jgi:hypothetical protein
MASLNLANLLYKNLTPLLYNNFIISSFSVISLFALQTYVFTSRKTIFTPYPYIMKNITQPFAY